MKKIILLLLATTLLLFSFSMTACSQSSSFDLNGCWKSNEKYPLNIIQFENNIYKYGKFSEKCTIDKKDGLYIVSFVGGKIIIKQENNNNIKVTYPNPALPKNIEYTRISKEDADKIIKQ